MKDFGGSNDTDDEEWLISIIVLIDEDDASHVCA